MGKRLGCLTANGLIAFVLTLLLVILTGLIGGGQMFSPGELHAGQGDTALGGVWSHAEIAQCAGCHAPPWTRAGMSERCLVCHTKVAQDFAAPTGLHNVLTVENGQINCYQCHTNNCLFHLKLLYSRFLWLPL